MTRSSSCAPRPTGPPSRWRWSAHDGRDDAVVPAELQDQVVDVGRRHRAQGRQLGRRLVRIEDVERPVTDGAALQVRVKELATEVGADEYRLDTGRNLLRPRKG